MIPSSAALEAEHPQPHAAAVPEASPGEASEVKSPRARSRAVKMILTLLVLVLTGAAVTVFLLPSGDRSGTPLGAAASLPGGLARVNGVLPLETDGWTPPNGSARFGEPAPEGMHRVRLLVEVTALDAQGIDFSADDWAITGLGSERPELFWADPERGELRQGDVMTATLVFQIPNQSIALNLEGPGGVRLALGVGHHTPGS
jgi:hypothetical protein